MVMSHHIAYRQQKQITSPNNDTTEISVSLDIEDVTDNIAGKEGSKAISSKGEDCQERTPKMSSYEYSLENLLCLCFVVNHHYFQSELQVYVDMIVF